MYKYFKNSFFITILGIIIAYLWGEHIKCGYGLTCMFVACFLAILEVSLSFDNAVVNAMKLEKMDKVWRNRFITWGILIAVFGMRFLFPLTIVSIFAKLGILNVLQMALNDVEQYTYFLGLAHAPMVTFGGAFLIMLFFDYFTNKKEVCWITGIERLLEKLSKYKFLCPLFTLTIIATVILILPHDIKIKTFISGVAGIITYVLINGFANRLEDIQNASAESAKLLKYSGVISFLYLELIDASFSLDGVLGAFAISSDIIIITIGLFIGAMFVRSLTIMLVEKKTLKQFIYLEHGAHWAIGVLAVLMFVSTFKEVPEYITGSAGFIIIVSSFISSIMANNRNA